MVQRQLSGAIAEEERVRKLTLAYRTQRAVMKAGSEALGRLMEGAGKGIRAWVGRAEDVIGGPRVLVFRLRSVAMAVVAARRLLLLTTQRYHPLFRGMLFFLFFLFFSCDFSVEFLFLFSFVGDGWCGVRG